MTNDILFSVIIPHKNNPNLLRRCLSSIPRREDIQIIVIDDNSDNHIVDFDNFLGLHDKFIEIYFTKEGKGAGYARNVGLDHAKGKWLLFADADDFFTESAFDCLFAQINSHNEIIYFKVESRYSDTLKLADRDKLYNSYVDDYLNNLEKDKIRYKYLSPWGKMIKTSFIKERNIKFDEVKAHNDIMFSILSGYFANAIAVFDDIIYCVTVNKGSITYTLNLDNLMSKYLVVLRRNEFLRKHDKKQYQSSIMYYLFFSRKYGIKTFLKFVKLAIAYKSNPFVGMNRWLTNGFTLYQDRKRKIYYIKKY
jgi:glycosyltransferase involved in cell wall biosynthesis